MSTKEILDKIDEEAKRDAEVEAKRLKEKVLCAEITFPTRMQKDLGITGLTMKASELTDFVESEIENRDSNSVTFSIRFMIRTNKWIESLPEANI